MDLTSIVFCPRCGAALDVSDDGGGGRTCADCGGRILLRRSATRTEAVALDDVEADRADALALLDRAWEEERGKHLLWGWKVLGVTVSWREPSDGFAALWLGAGLAGATWLLLGIATSGDGPSRVVSAALFVWAGVLAAVRELGAARAFARARRRYAASRAKLERGVPLDRMDWTGDEPSAMSDEDTSGAGFLTALALLAACGLVGVGVAAGAVALYGPARFGVPSIVFGRPLPDADRLVVVAAIWTALGVAAASALTVRALRDVAAD